MIAITTLFKPTAPYSALSAALYERFIAPAIQRQNQVLMDQVFDIDRLTGGARILDVGCGSGALVCDLLKRNPTFEVTGLDRSSDQIARARRRVAANAPNGRLVIGDAESLPFADAQFDVVVSVGVLKHIAAKRRALEECARVLRPGGNMYVIEVDKDAVDERIRSFVGETAFPGPIKHLWRRLFKRHVVGKSMNIGAATALSRGLALTEVRVELTPRAPAFMIIGEKRGG